MAATVSNSKNLSATPFHIRQFRLSSMVDGQSETITHGEEGMDPFTITWSVITRPTSGAAINIQEESFSAANATVTLRAYGGDLTGAVIDVQLWFLDAAAQDTGSLDEF